MKPPKSIDRFLKFFKEEGVPVDVWIPVSSFSSGKATGADKIVTVSQAHFHFKNGDFLGVEADDMGHFEKKL